MTRRGYAAPCGDWSEPERKPTSHEVIERNHFINTLQPPLPQSFAKSPSFCSQIVFFQLIFPTDFIFQTNMTRFSKALLRIRKVSEQSLRDFSIPSLGVLTFVTPSTGLSPVSFEQERVKVSPPLLTKFTHTTTFVTNIHLTIVSLLTKKRLNRGLAESLYSLFRR